jgi:cytochrome P450
VWHVRGFEPARHILRGNGTRQAGFKAELVERVHTNRRRPILYEEGPEHLQHRKQTARFFTPATTSASYRDLMESLADAIVADLQRDGRGDLSRLSMRLAVGVASRVVGLTDSRLPGLHRRLEAFFTTDMRDYGWSPRGLYGLLRAQAQMLGFYLLDVRPAIIARRRKPQEDVISHLIEHGYGDSEILIECVTFAAAGMVTTREFICVATWHLLEQPELRQRYLAADEADRHQLLSEILRLEPVVGHLFRRATSDIEVEVNGESVTIPAGDLIDLHIYAANADETVAGEAPLAIWPGRKLKADRVTAAVLSFGDGHHRCPGAYIAIQESDIFLQKLLSIEGLQIERPPALNWNDLTQGYELRKFQIAINQG